MPQNYTDVYTRLSNAELLETINNAGDYDPLAVNAAKLEWEKRNLSQEQVLQTEKIFREKLERRNRIERNAFLLKEKSSLPAISLQNKWRKIKRENYKGFLYALIVSIIMVVSAAINLRQNIEYAYSYISFTFQYGIDIYVLFALAPVFNIVTVIYFIIIKRVGWFLVFINYTAASALSFFQLGIYFFGEKSIYPQFGPSVVELLFPLIISVFVAVLTSQKDLRSHFRISRRQMFITAWITVPVTLIFIISVNGEPQAYALALLELCLTGLWMYFAEHQPVVRKTGPSVAIDQNIFETDPDAEVVVEPVADVKYLHELLSAKRKDRTAILQVLGSMCPDRTGAVSLLEDYNMSYHEDLIKLLIGLNSEYKTIKVNLAVFIQFNVVESEYPHNRIL